MGPGGRVTVVIAKIAMGDSGLLSDAEKAGSLDFSGLSGLFGTSIKTLYWGGGYRIELLSH